MDSLEDDGSAYSGYLANATSEAVSIAAAALVAARRNDSLVTAAAAFAANVSATNAVTNSGPVRHLDQYTQVKPLTFNP